VNKTVYPSCFKSDVTVTPWFDGRSAALSAALICPADGAAAVTGPTEFDLASAVPASFEALTTTCTRAPSSELLSLSVLAVAPETSVQLGAHSCHWYA
jgi:hypothetical protein